MAGGSRWSCFSRSFRPWVGLFQTSVRKDCKVDIMDDVKREGKGLEEALARGVFCELGEGDSGIGEVIATLKSNGYAGWLVVEQDRFLRQTDTLETLFQSNVRNREYLTALRV